MARLPAGLMRPGGSATHDEVAAAEKALGTRLPTSYVSFLESFDGADLFHEAVRLAGVGTTAPRRLVEINERETRSSVRALVFAEAAGGDRFAFRADGRVLRLRLESDECWIAGGDFPRWLDGLVAYHRVLYGPDGEFAPDVFEADASEVVPLVVLKQTERALRLCPDSAEWHHEQGVALRRLGRLGQAKEAFATAAALDPENPWPWFDVGRVGLDLGPRAARTEALAREPALADQLRRARDAARLEGDSDEVAEAEALLDALVGPLPTGRARLPVVSDERPHDPHNDLPNGPRAARADGSATAEQKSPRGKGQRASGNRRGPEGPGRVNDEAVGRARRSPPPDPHRRARSAPPRSGASRQGPRR